MQIVLTWTTWAAGGGSSKFYLKLHMETYPKLALGRGETTYSHRIKAAPASFSHS